MTEELQKDVREATKARVEVTESFKAWPAIRSEPEVIMEAKKLQEKDLWQCFKKRCTMCLSSYVPSGGRELMCLIFTCASVYGWLLLCDVV